MMTARQLSVLRARAQQYVRLCYAAALPALLPSPEHLKRHAHREASWTRGIMHPPARPAPPSSAYVLYQSSLVRVRQYYKRVYALLFYDYDGTLR